MRSVGVFWLLLAGSVAMAADSQARDETRDILVTLSSEVTPSQRSFGAPYRNRKRYRVSLSVRRQAEHIAKDYSLVQIDSWPIRSLAVHCIVFRTAEEDERDVVLRRLASDARVESAQPLHTFETQVAAQTTYDDTYANLQHGIETMSIVAAHRHSVGDGVRVAIIDGGVDADHEDLKGRVRSVRSYIDETRVTEIAHGTAVTSVIGARANNAKGIVGVAPRAALQVHAACWVSETGRRGLCDSFSLAQALDAVVANPPDVVNLSLTGPQDALLSRLLRRLMESGVVVVAAHPMDADQGRNFPASLADVIGVAALHSPRTASPVIESGDVATAPLVAPGNEILVAIPNDRYDFRSGSSIAAAHVTGVVALLLAEDASLSTEQILHALRLSQSYRNEVFSVDACAALQFVHIANDC